MKILLSLLLDPRVLSTDPGPQTHKPFIPRRGQQGQEKSQSSWIYPGSTW